MSAIRFTARALKTTHLLSNSQRSNILLSKRSFTVTKSRNMKFLQYTSPHTYGVRVGYLDGDKVVDINSADSKLPTNLLDLLRTEGALEKVQR